MSAVARPLSRVARLPLFVPLRTRDYRLVWFGESLSLLGDQFHLVALSWLVLGLTGSGLALGTVMFAAAVPRGIFVLVGGVLSDRVSPRTLMFWSNLVRAVVTGAIAILVLGGRIEIWHLLVVGVVFGTVDAVFFPAISTIVARLVPEDQLAPANAVLQGTQQLMGTVGPALAGVAVAIIGVGPAFVLDATSFVVAATAVWLVNGARGGVARSMPGDAPDGADVPAASVASDDARAPSSEMAMPRQSVRAAMVEGTRAVLGDPVMRTLVVLSTAVNLAFTGPIGVGLPWLAQVRFAGDASLLGYLFAAFGGGSLLGVIAAGTAPRAGNLGAWLVAIAAGLGFALAAIGLAPAPVVAILLGLIGLGAGYLNVSVISWAQARSEPHLLGRTMSFLMLGSVVAAPLSLAISGAAVDVNATALYLGAGALVVASALVGLASGMPKRMV